MIVLLLLTFTDMANIFANSIGLRIATNNGIEETSNFVQRIHEKDPSIIAFFDFQPNISNFIFYLSMGFFIIFIVNVIENKEDYFSKKKSKR